MTYASKPILFSLIVSISITLLVFNIGFAASNLVTVRASNNDLITTLQFTNTNENISEIGSFVLQISQGWNFQSFKTDSSWVAQKTSNTLTFTSANPLKAGQSINFIIKTDKPNPSLSWKALDKNNNQLDAGDIGKQSAPGETTTGKISENNPSNSSPKILDGSSFRIIPSSPRPTFDVRVIGTGFASSANLDLYIGSNKIDSFTSNNRGSFIITTKIPNDQPAGSVNFFVKDDSGNSKTFSTTIQEFRGRGITNQNVPLTANINPLYHRGDTQLISGTARAGNTVTISILDSNDTSITTFTTIANKTNLYSISNVIPIDRPFGKYSISVSDGQNKIVRSFNVDTTHQISISTSSQQIDPGKIIIINGTAISNQPITFRIKDPSGTEVFSKDANVTSDGKVAVAYTVDAAALKGTYVITASQGTDEVTSYFGVGEPSVPQITVAMDKLNYVNSEKPTINISGPSSSNLNLVIVDPSGKQKFTDAILVGPDGFATYTFNVTSYTPGIYAAVITRGNDKEVANFAIGLTTGSGQITMKTVKDSYILGDNIILLGKSNPNTIIKVTLTDPNGVVEKILNTFTDKTGIFSSTDFRIPRDGAAGIWKLEATSGINHVGLALTIRSSNEGISVKLDRAPPTYSLGDIVTISGFGAGNTATTTVDIIGLNNTKAESLYTTSTNRGEYNTLWKIPLNFNPGTYTVQVKSAGKQTTAQITIQ